MALNIKNDEAHRLARELAEARGLSLTDAVTEALRQGVKASSRADDDEELLIRQVASIQDFLEQLPDRDRRGADEILGYDEHGLPR